MNTHKIGIKVRFKVCSGSFTLNHVILWLKRHNSSHSHSAPPPMRRVCMYIGRYMMIIVLPGSYSSQGFSPCRRASPRSPEGWGLKWVFYTTYPFLMTTEARA